MAANEQQQTEKTKALVAELESYKQNLRAAAEEYDLERKRDNSYRAAGYRDMAALPAGAIQ